MEWRGLSTANAFVGNFFFIAGIGMVLSAQWELVRGNSYNYTVFSAYGMFYGGFGAILTPLFGVSSSFADDEVGYNNALGFFCIRTLSLSVLFMSNVMAVWTVFNTFFLLGSFTTDAVTIATYSALEIYLCLLGASYFVAADGGADGAIAIKKAAGSFAFVAGMLGYYSMGNVICKDQGLPAFLFPMGKVGFGAVAASSSKQEMRKSSIS
ncbi:Protein alcS [Diplodia seriata]|uniref:Protein alcS n=1 Tax=Diplodia seriata TaxID=420778 RepID=A0A1S8BL82_9PEZI|nr:Protein alcS [Diplodia seriata]